MSEQKQQPKQPQPKKANVSGKILQSFIQKDVKDIGQYLLYDRAIPALKKAILDIGCGIMDGVKGSFSMLLYGDDRSTQSSGSNQVPYNQYFKAGPAPKPQSSITTVGGFRLIEHDTDEQAHEVLRQMREQIAHYPVVRVADYYEYAHYGHGEYSANNYGWKDLTDVKVIQIPNGKYVLTLPKAVPV